jgi:hypothetical protein
MTTQNHGLNDERISNFVNCQAVYRQDVLSGLEVPPSAKDYIEALEVELEAVEKVRLELARVLDRVKHRILDEIYGRK